MDHQRLWREGFDHEREFWQKWKGGSFHRWLAIADREVRTTIKKLVPGWSPSTVVLDVGSGAISVLGNTAQGIPFRIVQADPLEGWFEKEFGQRPHMSYAVKAEHLTAIFNADSFDLVVSINALDHTADPFTALSQIAKVTKGPVYLEHFPNVAEKNNWAGLHQWNFDICHGVPVIWSRDRVVDVPHALGALRWNAWLEDRGQNQVLCISARVKK